SSSTGSCRHSYHSSSSSLGSIPPEEICNFDVSSMIAQGLPDTEILNAWLTGVHFECYYQNFIQAGYDMQTIVKMTPEDLNAIGITKPNHRKRLKSEISQLIIPDGLLDYIPSTIEEWLRALRMEEYAEKLKAQGYTNVRQVTNITWEDLEDIGILKLGHQKKFLLAIKRIEDILSGKRIHTTGAQNPYHHAIDCYAIPHRLPQTSNASQMPYSQHVSSGHNNPNQAPQVHGPPRGYINSFQKGFTTQQSVPPFTWRQHSVGKEEHYAYNESLYSSAEKPHLQLLTHQPQIHQQDNNKPVSNGISQPEYHPEVIAIHVKNDRRPSAIAEHCGEPIYGTSSFQAPSQPPTGGRNHVNTTNKWLEDGETTPTNEAEARVGNSYVEPPAPTSNTVLANSTLPRLMKNKALGKAAAANNVADAGQDAKGNPNNSNNPSGLDITYRDQCSPSPAQWQQQQQQHQSMDGYKSLPKNMGRIQSTFGTPKNPVGMRQPPPPPRRSTSTTQDRQETFSTFYPASSVTAGGTLKPQQSWSNKSIISDDNDLPAPPPPEDLALMSGSSEKSVPTPASHNSMNNSTSSSTSLTNSSSNNPASTTNMSDYHHLHHHNNTYANNSSTNALAYSSNSRIIHPSTSGSGRLRDPSPGASDSDLATTFATVGVRRNGSDASFKSSSSTESESIPFANDNAGTIKQQKPGSRVPVPGTLDSLYAPNGASGPTGEHIEAGDVLSDIGNMLADLTDELDAILQQEMNSLNKR
ncbi:Caskin-1, partial [Orchesella cincta]